MKALLALALAAAAAPLSAQSAMVSTSGGGRSEISMTVPLGRTAMFNGTPVRPVRVIEDSRCPMDVTCVWRGRLRVEVAIGRARVRTVTLEDGKPIPFEGGLLTLVGTRPAPRANAPRPSNLILRYTRG